MNEIDELVALLSGKCPVCGGRVTTVAVTDLTSHSDCARCGYTTLPSFAQQQSRRIKAYRLGYADGIEAERKRACLPSD